MLLATLRILLQTAAPALATDAKLLRDARTAQVRFESHRRMHLPRDWAGGGRSAGRCDAQIGRYCYWYDSIESPVVPEPHQIADARETLIRLLDSAASRNPADPWIAGQRARYLIEGGHPDEAAAAARACRADGWWCAALEGLALHVDQWYSAADSVYAVAMRQMPAAQRCQWLDLQGVAGGYRLERELARASCSEREHLADRLWTLSQPLWSTPGNDLRTEHFARLTMAAILARSANGHGMACGDDSRKLLIRYGWAEWFSRHDSGPGVYTSPSITGHDREPSYYFFPDVRSVRPNPRITPASWAFRLPTARTRYAPRHLKALSELAHQLVRFPRGDSMLVAVAFRVRDTALARDSLVSYLGAYRHGELRVTGGGPQSGVLWLTLPNDTSVASIEVRGDSSHRAARARYTIDPLRRGGTAALSDLLLFDPSRGHSGGGTDVRMLMSAATTDTRHSSLNPLGVYWELEGTPSSSPVWLSLTVEPLGVGLARRVATRLHLAPAPAPVRLRWQTVIKLSLEGQRVTLRLPPGARGRYRVTLTVEPSGAPPLTSSREIELMR